MVVLKQHVTGESNRVLAAMAMEKQTWRKLFDPALGDRPRVPHGEVFVGCRSAPSWGSALGFRVVAAAPLHVWKLGPGGEPAGAVCVWSTTAGTVPSRGLTVRLTISDAENKKQQQLRSRPLCFVAFNFVLSLRDVQW